MRVDDLRNGKALKFWLVFCEAASRTQGRRELRQILSRQVLCLDISLST